MNENFLNILAYYKWIDIAYQTCSKVNPRAVKAGPFDTVEGGRRYCDLDIHCTGVLVINGNKYVDALDVYLCEGEFIADTQKKNLVFQKGKPKFDRINF